MKMTFVKSMPLVLLLALFSFSGCTRTFMVLPQKKNLDFTVQGRFGKLNYTPVTDNRNELDRKGQKPGACNGGAPGVTVLGDENYKTNVLHEINRHIKNSLLDANLFTEVIQLNEPGSDSDYRIKVSLDRFNVTLDEEKAVQAQACIGGFLGAAVAASIDVQATSDISLFAVLYKGNQEVWRKSASKRIVKIDDYGNTSTNAENAMGESIGEATKEIVTELAKYLATNS